ncbi:MAG: hypothetical protein KF751_07635 [Nitrospira sp.]|nr:hypothetical protein [Nitrospira sp.]MBX3348966.1 hypothetical protein [Nitrospira sp.]
MTVLSALFSRAATYIVFVVVIAAVSLYRHSQNLPHPTSEWISESSLPPNTRIKTNELRKPNFPVPADAFNFPGEGNLEGRYVNQEVRENCPVILSNLRLAPSLEDIPGKVLLFFNQKEAAAVIDHLNADDTVYLRSEDNGNHEGPFPVAAVLGEKESRVLVISVPVDKAKMVRDLQKPVFHIASLRARDTAPPHSESHRCG